MPKKYVFLEKTYFYSKNIIFSRFSPFSMGRGSEKSMETMGK